MIPCKKSGRLLFSNVVAYSRLVGFLVNDCSTDCNFLEILRATSRGWAISTTKQHCDQCRVFSAILRYLFETFGKSFTSNEIYFKNWYFRWVERHGFCPPLKRSVRSTWDDRPWLINASSSSVRCLYSDFQIAAGRSSWCIIPVH